MNDFLSDRHDQLPHFSYFLTTYFTTDCDKEQLKQIIAEYCKEDPKKISGLIVELKMIREKNKWHSLSDFMQHFGRDYSLPKDKEKLKELVNLLISLLSINMPNKARDFHARYHK